MLEAQYKPSFNIIFRLWSVAVYNLCCGRLASVIPDPLRTLDPSYTLDTLVRLDDPTNVQFRQAQNRHQQRRGRQNFTWACLRLVAPADSISSLNVFAISLVAHGTTYTSPLVSYHEQETHPPTPSFLALGAGRLEEGEASSAPRALGAGRLEEGEASSAPRALRPNSRETYSTDHRLLPNLTDPPEILRSCWTLVAK
ncbi:hypothetical protein BaRGS_00039970 [Batillaria attramentaria]|uniref:Uncharacterized protein n=1 Tax=Batillaria attramentaria TaxID=370345 RepID=A0ABD0J291_9CAEN